MASIQTDQELMIEVSSDRATHEPHSQLGACITLLRISPWSQVPSSRADPTESTRCPGLSPTFVMHE